MLNFSVPNTKKHISFNLLNFKKIIIYGATVESE